MNNNKKKILKQNVERLFKSGFFSIFLSSILIKVVGLLGNILLVRILSKGDYGLYSYVSNAYSVLTLLADMGTCATTIQFCSESYKNEEKLNSFYSYGFKLSMFFNIISAFIILSSVKFYNYKFENTAFLTASLFLLPFVTNVNYFILGNLQIRLQNNKYAKINLFSSLIRYFILLPLSYFFTYKGAIYSDYLIQISILIYGMHTSKGLIKFNFEAKYLTKEDKKNFLKLSFGSAINNTMNNSLVLLDVFLLGIFIGNLEVIASYKVAAIIPIALMFIPSSVQVYVLPLFARYHNDYLWVKKSYVKMITSISIFNMAIVLFFCVFGKYIFTFMYGNEYIDANKCFCILMIGYLFSSIRFLTYAILYTQRKIKINIVLTIIFNILNIILDIFLIKEYGSLGVAISSTIVNIISALLLVIYFLTYIRKVRFEGYSENL